MYTFACKQSIISIVFVKDAMDILFYKESNNRHEV